MYLSKHSDTALSNNVISSFRGYNHTPNCGDGECYDMNNLTLDNYPTIGTRKHRGFVYQYPDNKTVLLKDSQLISLSGKYLYMGEEKINSTELDISTLDSMYPKQLVKMGAYIIIFPDKVWINTETKETGKMESEFTLTTTTESSFVIENCKNDGTAISEYPYEPVLGGLNIATDGDYIDYVDNGKNCLKQWSGVENCWINNPVPLIKITATGIGDKFELNDSVVIKTTFESSWETEMDKEVIDNETWYTVKKTIYKKDSNYIIVRGNMSWKSSARVPSSTNAGYKLSVKREVPKMTHVIECNNRLWGCASSGHEIYASKLGDFKNWNSFNGVSTDSYAANLGSSGYFTGSVVYQGNPIFFKEDYLVKVTVSSNGGHQVKELPALGLQENSSKSIAVINDVLYYKNENGIVAYNGGTPTIISKALGTEHYKYAVGGNCDSKYYVSMRDSNLKYQLFCYDTANGMWTHEDSIRATQFCNCNGELFFIDYEDKWLKSIKGLLPSYDHHLNNSNTKKTEGNFDWMMETGNIGYSLSNSKGKQSVSMNAKYIQRINLKVDVAKGTKAKLYIQYDSTGNWEYICDIKNHGIRTFAIPLIPRRCDHFKYKIVGNGDFRLISMLKTIEQGSDLVW